LDVRTVSSTSVGISHGADAERGEVEIDDWYWKEVEREFGVKARLVDANSPVMAVIAAIPLRNFMVIGLR